MALSDALPVIAVDTNPAKEAYAVVPGATQSAPTAPTSTWSRRSGDQPNSVDFVFECVGSTALIRTSTDLLDWGGTLAMLGVPG